MSVIVYVYQISLLYQLSIILFISDSEVCLSAINGLRPFFRNVLAVWAPIATYLSKPQERHALYAFTAEELENVNA